jgi:PAS domain S-box-containing protein
MAFPKAESPDLNTASCSISVLLVDDDRDFVELASRFLKSAGVFHVDGAYSGRSALEKLAQNRYDVIICDYLMPEMDGIQFLREARSRGFDAPFILMTGKELDDLPSDLPASEVGLHVRKSGDIRTQFAELSPMIRNLANSARFRRQLVRDRDLYRHIVDLTNEGIWSVDAGGRITFANPKMASMMACSASEMIGKSFSDLVPDEAGAFADEALELCRDGTDVEIDFEFKNRAGRRHVVSFKASRIVGQEDEYLGAVAVFIDVASRMLVEEALMEALRAREEFEKIVNASPVVVFQLDPVPPWKVEFVSDNVTQFGFTPDEFTSGRTTFADVVHPDNLELIQEEVVRRITSGEDMFDLDYLGLTKNGETRHLDARVFVQRDAEGNVVRFQGVILDETERRRNAEEAERLASIVENSMDAIISKSLDGTILTWNPAAESMYGYSADEVIGKPISMLVPPEHLEDFYRKFRQVKRGKRVVSYETSRVRKNGALIDVSLTISPLRDRAGKIVGASAIARDITERKRAEEALRTANEKLSLMGSITRHDVINQIGILTGYLSLLEDDQDAPSRAEHIQAARRACITMAEQLQFAGSYQKAGTKDPEWTRVRLELAGAASSIDMGDISVADSLGDLEVLADPMFEKVFLNLLLNTRRHGEKATEVRVGYDEREGDVLITYQDDGIGIPSGEKEKVFERGFGKDSGLGLFLIREILSITGIEIAESGTPGEGARFEITVPQGRYRFGSETPEAD